MTDGQIQDGQETQEERREEASASEERLEFLVLETVLSRVLVLLHLLQFGGKILVYDVG